MWSTGSLCRGLPSEPFPVPWALWEYWNFRCRCIWGRFICTCVCMGVNTLCVVGKGSATELRSSARRNHWSDLMGSLGVGGLIFSQKFIQTSGTFSMYSSISIALPPKLWPSLLPHRPVLGYSPMGRCTYSEGPQRDHFLSSKYMCFLHPSQFSPSRWQSLYCSTLVTYVSCILVSERCSFMVNCPRHSSLSHLRAQVCRCVAAHKYMCGKFSEFLFNQRWCFAGKFQNLFAWGKGNGSVRAMQAWAPGLASPYKG